MPADQVRQDDPLTVHRPARRLPSGIFSFSQKTEKQKSSRGNAVEGQACGEQKDGCEPRMSGPVIRDAGHQTSLFSIRPPEVLQRASLEASPTSDVEL
jgi:hypothetical protein